MQLVLHRMLPLLFSMKAATPVKSVCRVRKDPQGRKDIVSDAFFSLLAGLLQTLAYRPLSGATVQSGEVKLMTLSESGHW